MSAPSSRIFGRASVFYARDLPDLFLAGSEIIFSDDLQGDLFVAVFRVHGDHFSIVLAHGVLPAVFFTLG